MALPEAVQRQAEALAAYDERVTAATEPAPAPAEPATQDPPPPEPVTTTEAASPTPEPRRASKRQPDKDDEDTWKQRYYGLQGVFNVTVPPLQERVKSLEAQLEELQRQPRTPTEPKVKPNGARVTQQDVDAFGQDLIDMVDRKAQDVVDRVSAAYEERIKQLEAELTRATGTLNSVAKTQVATEQDRFFKALGDAVSNWEAVQETAECQQWLATRIPGLKTTWDEALKKAADELDSRSAIEVFQAFLAAHPQFGTNTKVVSQQSRDVQRQVAPEKTTATPVRTPGQKRIFSTAEFQQESEKLIRLAKAGNHVEAARIENELNAAMAEGRIRP